MSPMPHTSRDSTLRRLKEGYFYGLNAWRSLADDQIRVVLFAQGRTGSTLLESLLVSTGHFVKQGEILSCDAHEVRYPLAYTLGKAKRLRGRNFFFHVKVYQLTRDRHRPVDPAGFLRELHDHGWKILYLRRENFVRHALSTFVAEARGAYHRFHDKDESLRIEVKISSLRALLRQRKEFARQEVAALADLPRVELSYERDLADAARHQATIDRILDTLGLERRPATAETRKVNRFRPRELVSNFDEVDALLRAEGLEW